MDLNRVPPILLQTFFVVAEVGQISEAARRLHRSRLSPATSGGWKPIWKQPCLSVQPEA
jgi:hypothetical protein